MTETRDGEAAPRRGQDQPRAARRDDEGSRRDARRPQRQREDGDGAGEERAPENGARKGGRDGGTAEGREGESRARPRLRASEVARAARHEIHELTGRQIEGVTSVQRGDNGWRVGVEVVESHRIPDTTDILAVYEADIDESGELAGYRRVERYARGKGYER